VIRWRTGVVESLGRAWPGALELQARAENATLRCLAYPAMVGTPAPGDGVLLNTTALDQGLGTGGYALVIAVLDGQPADENGAGHLVKARYTPQQVSVQGVDEQDSPYHEMLRDADSLDGMPVVVADLHSALPAVAAAVAADRPGTRLVYVMTDGGALPLWFSRTVATLREAELLVGSVTVGQAFGGDLEAVTLHTGLLAARLALEADLAVVAQGPGNLGTGTRWGFSGVAAGEAVNAVAVLSGRPIASLRISDADARPRHRGVSHHSLTAYGRVALAAADVIVPAFDSPLREQIEHDLTALRQRHRIVEVEVDGLEEALRQLPVRLSTMGRDYESDRAYFLAAAAAGRHAVALLG
jgi:Protein of unknown function (DUF3866)